MGIFIKNLENLKEYKYQGDDRSIITKYFLKPYWWTNFVKIFPNWFAPNLVTLSGFGFILVNLITCFFYDPYLDNVNVPSWTLYSYAFGLFMYQTFDAVDGMQARKTGQSGPLGELFDHCVDALNTSLSVIIFASATKMGYGWTFIISQFGVLANFYISTWEEYHTHVLYLSEFSGPVEGILMIVVLYIVTGFTGSKIWTTTWYTVDLVNYLPSFIINGLIYLNLINLKFNEDGAIQALASIDLSSVYLTLGVSSIFFNIKSAYGNVKAHYAKDKSIDYVKKSKEAFKGLYPFIKFYGSIVIFVFISSPYIFTNSSSFIPLILQIGTSMAFNVGNIIISHLTLSEFPFKLPTIYLPRIQIGVLVLVKILNLLRVEQISMAVAVNNVSWVGFGVSLGIYGCFITEIITEITQFLDIWVLTIKHPRKLD